MRVEFAYAGGGLGKGGTATLFVDGKKVGEGNIPMTQAMIFSADDGCDVGEDSGAPVSPDYGPQGNTFNGNRPFDRWRVASRFRSSHRACVGVPARSPTLAVHVRSKV